MQCLERGYNRVMSRCLTNPRMYTSIHEESPVVICNIDFIEIIEIYSQPTEVMGRTNNYFIRMKSPIDKNLCRSGATCT